MAPAQATRALAGALLRDALAGRGLSAGPRLVRIDDPGGRAPLADGLTIGRSPRSALRVAAPEVSRVHARVVGGDAGFAIEDAGSKNGLRVNGRTVRGRARLADGDVVQVGPARLRVEGIGDLDRDHDPDRERGRGRGHPPPLRLATALLLLASAAALLAAAS